VEARTHRTPGHQQNEFGEGTASQLAERPELTPDFGWSSASALRMGSGVEGPAVSRALQKSRNTYDFNVWSEMKFVEKLRYIHRNSVRRALVARPEDWAWSSFRHYATGETSALEIESQWTARRWEQTGIFVTVRVRSAEENPQVKSPAREPLVV
jgi:hypothetical protein